MDASAFSPTARPLAALLLALVGCGGPSVLDLNYQRGDYSQKVRPVRVGVYYFEDNRPGWPATAAMRMFDGGHGGDAGMKHTIGGTEVNAFVAQALRAFDAAGDASLLYNIGLCYRRAGDAERALAAYREYLRRVPGSPHRSNVEARIEELKQELRPNRKS